MHLKKSGEASSIHALKRNYHPETIDNDYTLLGSISNGTSAKRFTGTITALFQMPCWDGYSISIAIRPNGFIRD